MGTKNKKRQKGMCEVHRQLPSGCTKVRYRTSAVQLFKVRGIHGTQKGRPKHFWSSKQWLPTRGPASNDDQKMHLVYIACWVSFFFFFLLFNFGHQPLYGAVFQHNNAKTIAARYTTLFVAYNIVQILLCLPSPWISLHPIEHIWDELDRRVRGRLNAPAKRA